MSKTISSSDSSGEIERLRAELVRTEVRLAEAQRIAQIGSWEWDIEEDRGWWSPEIHSIFGMAHALGLKVIAEGVETAAQLQFLHSYACDEIQGYFFSRPLGSADLTKFLRERQRVRSS